ncbi:hypothetical protein ANN_28121 [Periplaneta americana]|uniref:tRNA (guanine(37)-N1)-methyltransferase n=1 Tax=Periplaneta americana TaxID=6978 RepID=A0ABQ8S5Q3_PERAM|nr:hypothetical protein ANN_28121 [Periplaneta americana]
MSSMSDSSQINQSLDRCLLRPPTSVRGMKTLDRSKFLKSINVPWLLIDETRLGPMMKHIKRYLLKVDNFKPVQLLDCGKNRKVILNPMIVRCYKDLEDAIQSCNISEDSLKFENIELTYENWRADELLKAILPEDKDSLTSYSIIGHIVHINLREHLLDYKHIIGQILLDKVKGAKTVVNKTDIIDNTYRNFNMEVLCGEDNFFAQVRENHCTFEFDFSSVYWNPRLSSEHERIVQKIKEGDILYDVFAGVGPFAIPAAKKKCIVLANDLNPESHKWLLHNGKINKVLKLLQTFNKDGGDFIKYDMKRDMLQRWQSGNYKSSTMHITMNLPAMAATFLKYFKALFTSSEVESIEVNNFPVVHLYCFAKGDDPIAIAKELVEENLDTKLKDNLVDIFHVRNVSVNKEMMRVTFSLPKDVCIEEQCKISKRCSEDLPDKSQIKRQCFGENGEDHQV